MTISINILNDQKPGRELQRTISLLNIYSKTRIAVSNGRAHVNVFGGYQKPPNAHFHKPGDIPRQENFTNLIRHVVRKYKPGELAVVLENDVIPCTKFIKYIQKSEKTCPNKDSLRVGYSPLPRLVKHFRQCIHDRRSQWVELLTANWFCGPCIWLPVEMWARFLHFIERYSTDKFQLDTVVRDWLITTGQKRVSVLVPNAALHIGRNSSVYRSGTLRGESEENTFPKQSFCYLEDPFGMGDEPWTL